MYPDYTVKFEMFPLLKIGLGLCPEIYKVCYIEVKISFSKIYGMLLRFLNTLTRIFYISEHANVVIYFAVICILKVGIWSWTIPSLRCLRKSSKRLYDIESCCSRFYTETVTILSKSVLGVKWTFNLVTLVLLY